MKLYQNINPYEVDQYIGRAAIIFVDNEFYVFGGLTDIDGYTIAKLDVNLVWTRVGYLKWGRNGHNVIFDGEFALVVGGSAGEAPFLESPTEKCSISTDGVNCTEQSPSLRYYSDYPELFMIPPNYCKST